MGNICSRGPKTQVLLEQELDKLGSKFPQIIAACLISEDGKTIVAQMSSRIQGNGEAQDIDYTAMMPLINAYRKSATLFGQTLQHYDNRAMHIRAQQTLFSSYALAKYSLNILTEIQLLDDNSPIELIETNNLDANVEQFGIKIREILEAAAQAN